MIGSGRCRAVYHGERYLNQSIADLLTTESFQKLKSSSDINLLEVLGPREREILQLVAEGKTSQEIARRLSISPKAVDTCLGIRQCRQQPRHELWSDPN